MRDKSLRGVIALDTSGSIDEQTFGMFACQVERLAKGLRGHWTVIECDAEIQREYTLRHRLHNDLKGRGGTRFAPVFDRARTIQPDVLIYFTDGANGDGKMPRVSFPVLWALPSRYYHTHQQHGKTIVM